MPVIFIYHACESAFLVTHHTTALEASLQISAHITVSLCRYAVLLTVDLHKDTKVNTTIPLWNEEVKLVLQDQTCFDETCYIHELQ